MRIFDKFPGDVLDYSIDWFRWLAGDAILTSTWSVAPTGPTLSLGSNTTTTTTIWASGGTLGVLYTITCVITTAAGRTKAHAFQLSVLTE